MWITEFDDYKAFLNAYLKTMPKAGRGQSRRLAEHLRVAPTVISQILSRERHFTPDQAVKVAIHFGFDSATTEYFLCLVHLGRADSKELRSYYTQRINRIREESEKIKNLVKGKEELSDSDKGRFYSNWYYTGVRLLCSIEGYQSIDSIADYFGLKRSRVNDIVSFLVENGLCSNENGQIRMATKSTHVSAESYFVNNHRRNWREKAREKFTDPGERDFFYSSPVSISKKDAEQFRKELLELIKSFSRQVEPSEAEALMCLNIDWFEF